MLTPWCGGTPPRPSDCVVAIFEELGLVKFKEHPEQHPAHEVIGGVSTLVAERIDGGKLRVTRPAWDDAVVIHPAESLCIVNIERQAHVLRASAPGAVLRARRHPPILAKTILRSPTNDHFPVTRGQALERVAERIDGGKLRITCPAWDDAVVIHPSESLCVVNIERQAHVLRAPAPLAAIQRTPTPPDPGEDDLEVTDE